MVHICIIDMYIRNIKNANILNFLTIFHKIDKSIELSISRYDTPDIIKKIVKSKPDAIIISGSEFRILHHNAFLLPKKLLRLNIPILGICYGFQWMTLVLQGSISSYNDMKLHNYSKIIHIRSPFLISNKLYELSHYDYIEKVPPKWIVSVKRNRQIWMSFEEEKKFMGIQFHPEKHTSSGIAFFSKWLLWIS